MKYEYTIAAIRTTYTCINRMPYLLYKNVLLLVRKTYRTNGLTLKCVACGANLQYEIDGAQFVKQHSCKAVSGNKDDVLICA